MPSSILRTASLSMDADAGSMHMSETLFPNGNASILSPVRAMKHSSSRNSTVLWTTDSMPNICDVVPKKVSLRKSRMVAD